MRWRNRLKLRPLATLLLLAATTHVAAGEQAPVDGKQSGYHGSGSFGGPSGVSEELATQDDFRDALFEPRWSSALFTPWFDWKRAVNDEHGLKLGVNVLMLAQTASADSRAGDDSAAGGMYRFQGSWRAFSSDTSVGEFSWRVESRSNIGGVPA